MKILKLDFKKGTGNKTVLTDPENLDKLERWIFPVIERNEGWGTGNLTRAEFAKNPSNFQDSIDASVWGNVHVVLKSGKPVGLLEFSKSRFSDKSKKRHRILDKILEKKNFSGFEKLVGKKVQADQIGEIKEFLNSKNIYTSYGIVLSPDLQGKGSGISESLYKIVSDGILFGWTSNPLIVRLHRKLFTNTLFFPPLNEFPTSTAEMAICLYVYADRLTWDKKAVKGLGLGVGHSPYFVEKRGREYLEIATQMNKAGKITERDRERLKYVLSRKLCASAIVSWN